MTVAEMKERLSEMRAFLEQTIDRFSADDVEDSFVFLLTRDMEVKRRGISLLDHYPKGTIVVLLKVAGVKKLISNYVRPDGTAATSPDSFQGSVSPAMVRKLEKNAKLLGDIPSNKALVRKVPHLHPFMKALLKDGLAEQRFSRRFREAGSAFRTTPKLPTATSFDHCHDHTVDIDAKGNCQTGDAADCDGMMHRHDVVEFKVRVSGDHTHTLIQQQMPSGAKK